jgi:soluble P-type ATPase
VTLYSIPGLADLELEQLMLDVNGTLTNRGALIPDLAPRIARLNDSLDIHLVSADTFGTPNAIAQRLNVDEAFVVATVRTIGATRRVRRR